MTDSDRLEWVVPQASGLVRVQLSLNGPAHLLGPICARELAAALAAAAASAEAMSE